MTDDKAADFEVLIKRTAADLTSGVFLERIAPMALWERAERPVNTILEIATALKEEVLFLKPERSPTIGRHYNALVQKLNTFREILFQMTTEPLTNSRLGIEQLRQGLVEAADFLQLVKEAKTNPNPVIKTILDLKSNNPLWESSSFAASPKIELLKEEPVSSQKNNHSNGREEVEKKIKRLEEKIAGLEADLKRLRENIANK